MNHKNSFVIRFTLLLLLLALPVLACNFLSGGEEDGQTAITVEEADTQAGAAGNGEIVVEAAQDSPADDSGDSSGDTDTGSAGSDSSDEGADADSTEGDEATEDPAGSDSDAAPRSGNDGDDSDAGESDSADSDGDQVSNLPAGPSADGWGESGTGAQSACDHPYLPLRAGSSWTYENGQDTLLWEVTEVVGDLETATAVMRVTVGDVSIDYTWSCDSGSGLASFDLANVNSAATGMELTFEQLSADGQFLLPAGQLLPEATWETNLESAISFSQGEGDLQIDVTGNMTTLQTNRVLSTNPVTFDGQTVAGVQVEQTDDLTIVMVVLGNEVTQNVSLVNTTDYGLGIGRITQSSVSDFGTETSQLVSYFIP